MSNDLEIEFPATLSALRSCVTTIEDSCAAWNLDRDAATRIAIAVEELFSNTIKYGYGVECARPVRVRLRRAPELELLYEDEAPPFDPIAWLDAAQPAASPPDTVGRRGIAIVLGTARSARYERLPAGNRLTLRFG